MCVLVTDRSACTVSVSVSVAALLTAFESVTPVGAAIVAVFTSDPVVEAAIV